MLSPHSPRPSNAYRYYHRALVALRQALSEISFNADRAHAFRAEEVSHA